MSGNSDALRTAAYWLAGSILSRRFSSREDGMHTCAGGAVYPDDVLGAALHLLVAMTGVERVAVFLGWPRDGRLLWADRVDAADLSAVTNLQRAARRALQAGCCVVLGQRGERVVLPCRVDGALKGLLIAAPVPTSDDLPRERLLSLIEWLGFGLVPYVGDARNPRGRKLKSSGDLAERETLIATLEDCEWNIARAARRMAVTRTTVYRRLLAHGLDRERRWVSRRGVKRTR